MPRNGSGTFSLVSGNPVVTGTVIESNWANTTLSDIATTLTDSLSRSGQGGMTAALRIADGTQGAPGVGFANETGSGVYRAGTGEVWAVVQGAQTLKLDASGVYVPADKTTTVDGAFVFNEAGADKDARFEGDTDANLVFVDASTDRVGVGTNTPSTKLHVVGDVTVSGAVNATTLDLTNLEVTNIKAKDGTASMTLADATGVATFSANPILNAGTANGVLYLNGSKVATSGSALTYNGTNLTFGNAGGLAIFARVLDSALTGVVGSRSGSDMSLYNGGGTTSEFIAGANELRFNVAAAEQMRLTSTGLGIGTSSPTNTAGFSRQVQIEGTTAALTLSGTTGTGKYTLGVPGVNAVGLWDNTASAYRWYVDSSGNLGIGTSSPNSLLTLYTGAAFDARTSGINVHRPGSFGQYASIAYNGDATYFSSTYTGGGAGVYGQFIWQAYDSTSTPLLRMQLDTSGNLGLGVTPNGSYKLQVAGNAFFSTGVTVADTSAITWGAWTSIQENGFFDAGGNFLHNAIKTGGVNDTWTYRNNGFATRYKQLNSVHSWYTAPSGTAGNAISFTQAMTLDASGNLGVGTTSTSGLRLAVDSGSVAIAANFNSTNANGAYIRFQNSGTSIGDLGAGASVFSGGTAGDFGLTSRSGNLVFGTGSIERARITSGGDLLVGTTAQPSGASSRQVVKYDASDYVSYFWNANASPYGVRVQHDTDVNGTGNPFLICVGNATERASIRSNGGIANYSGNNVNLSDRREKTNFAPAKSYLDTICAIPVQTFEYIDQSEDDPGLTLGVVAQDVQAVAPELVMESNWGTEDDPKMRLSIYQTDLQYALMKCIQEQQALITDLRARVAALEAQP